jgi:putative glycosyltransferase (TIGR04348 family)
MIRIVMVCPGSRSGGSGKAVTARRWTRLLRSLGYRVLVTEEYDAEPGHLLLALHAGRSAASVRRFRRLHPGKPVVLALTGTDVYRDIHRSASARRCLEQADRLVLLQPLALEEIPGSLWARAVVIRQSVRMPWVEPARRPRTFDVAVLAHLRAVKDPFRAAAAAKLLPSESRIRILHAGTAEDRDWARRARDETRRNPRYVWRGELPRWRAKRLLAGSRLMVLSSRLEGGANVISEASVAGVPVLASRIPGTVGLLGSGYPGYFEVGDTRGLARLLDRAETDREFYDRLAEGVRAPAHLFLPSHERRAWKLLLEDLIEAPPRPEPRETQS